MRLSILTKLLYFIPLLALGADEFSVYHPKYKSTEELVNLGNSAFGDKASFSSLGGKVVINASPKTTASVLKLFGELDKVSRQFRISFRLVAREESSGNSISFKNGQVSVGKKISVDGTAGAHGGETVSQKEAVQSAQLMEGTEARMMLGSDWFPGGFIAKARGVAGNLVTVEFKQREGDADSAFSIQSEVLLKLGEWKSVGEVCQSHNGSQAGVLSRGAHQGSERKDLQVKLELAK